MKYTVASGKRKVSNLKMHNPDRVGKYFSLQDGSFLSLENLFFNIRVYMFYGIGK